MMYDKNDIALCQAPLKHNALPHQKRSLMKKLSLITTIMGILLINTMTAATPHLPNKLFDFIAQHSTEMAAYMHRSSKSFLQKAAGFKTTPISHKKSSQAQQRNRPPSATAEELAFTSVKESAMGGYVPAQDLLAYCYATGTGTKVNERLAFCWYLRAAIEGSKSARDSLLACFDEGVGIKADPQLCRLLKNILQ